MITRTVKHMAERIRHANEPLRMILVRLIGNKHPTRDETTISLRNGFRNIRKVMKGTRDEDIVERGIFEGNHANIRLAAGGRTEL